MGPRREASLSGSLALVKGARNLAASETDLYGFPRGNAGRRPGRRCVLRARYVDISRCKILYRKRASDCPFNGSSRKLGCIRNI